MTSWYLKAALQGSMSQLADPQRANRRIQRVVTGRLALSDAFFEKKLVAAEHHLDNWRLVTGRSGTPDRVVELGTGWHPVVPIAIALHGVGSVVTVDMQPLFQDEQVVETLEEFRSHIESGTSGFDASAASRVAMALAMSPGDGRHRLEALGVHSLTADSSRLEMAPASVDLVTSNNTLEHIPGEALVEILSEFRRLTKTDGVSSHLIDLADHYAGFDPKLTPYHFLRFSERQWAWFNNELQYQNRLRHSQYSDIFDQSGWFLHSEDLNGDISSLADEPVHAEFSEFSPDDLAIHTAWMAHRPGRVH